MYASPIAVFGRILTLSLCSEWPFRRRSLFDRSFVSRNVRDSVLGSLINRDAIARRWNNARGAQPEKCQPPVLHFV